MPGEPLPPVEPLAAFCREHGPALLDRLRAAGLDADAHAKLDLVSGQLPAPLQRAARAFALSRAEGPLPIVLRALIHRLGVPANELERVFGPLLSPMREAGILASAGDGLLSSRFQVSQLGDALLFADDLSEAGETVMGMGPLTVTLARASVGLAARSVLDLGCGAGALALAHAGTAEVVVATDLSPRAVALTEANLALNGASRVEVLLGDLFEPVRGRRFDLVVSQPPFIAAVSGDLPTVFLQGGARGDELPLRVLSELAAHLTREGHAVIVVEWPVGPGAPEPIPARVRRALAAPDRDVLYVTTAPTPALAVATLLASAERPALGTDFEARAAARAEHYERLGIQALVQSLIVVGPVRDRPGRDRVLSAPHLGTLPISGRRVRELLDAVDVAASPDAHLERTRLRVPPGTAFAQVQIGPGMEVESSLSARPRPETLLAARPLDAEELATCTAVHESDDVAAGLARAESEFGVELPRAALLDLVRRAVESGLLEPAAADAEPPPA